MLAAQRGCILVRHTEDGGCITGVTFGYGNRSKLREWGGVHAAVKGTMTAKQPKCRVRVTTRPAALIQFAFEVKLLALDNGGHVALENDVKIQGFLKCVCVCMCGTRKCQVGTSYVL